MSGAVRSCRAAMVDRLRGGHAVPVQVLVGVVVHLEGLYTAFLSVTVLPRTA